MNSATRNCSRGQIIDPNYLELLWTLFTKNPYVKKCGNFLIDRITQGGLRFYRGCENLKLRPKFQRIIDVHWVRFSRECMENIIVQGFVPYTFVILSDGTYVPVVIKHGTYEVKVFFDIMSESLKYKVFRNVSSMETTDYMDTDSKPDDIKTKHYNQVREDLGTFIPEDNMTEDPTISVLDGFGFDPTTKGGLTSIMACIEQLLEDIDDMFFIHKQQQENVTKSKPWVEPAAMSDDIFRALTSAHLVPGDNQTALNNLTEKMTGPQLHSYVQQQVVFNKYRRQRGLNTDSTPFGSMLSKKEMAEANDTNIGNFNTVPPGSHVSSYKDSTDMKHLPFMQEYYERQICNIFKIPINLFKTTATTQGNSNMQKDEFDSTIKSWYVKLCILLTEVYNIIYGTFDHNGSMDYKITQWLEEERLKLVHEKLEEDAIKNGYTLDQLYNETDETSSDEDKTEKTKNEKNKAQDKEVSQPDENGPKKRRRELDNEYAKKRKRIRNGKYPNTLDHPWNQKILMSKMTGQISFPFAKYQKPDDETLQRLQERMKILKKVEEWGYSEEDQSYVDMLIEMYESIDQHLKPRITIEAFLKKVGSIEDMKERIIVSFSPTCNMSLAELTEMCLLGLINRAEFQTLARAHANLEPAQEECDYHDIMTKTGELLAAVKVKEIINKTSLAPILMLTEQMIAQNEQRAVKEAVRDVEIKYQLQIAKMQMAAKMQDAQQKKEKVKGEKSADAKKPEKEDKEDKEKEEEKNKQSKNRKLESADKKVSPQSKKENGAKKLKTKV